MWLWCTVSAIIFPCLWTFQGKLLSHSCSPKVWNIPRSNVVSLWHAILKTFGVSIFQCVLVIWKAKKKKEVKPATFQQHIFHRKCWICAIDKQAHLDKRTCSALKYSQDSRIEEPESAKLAVVYTAAQNILLRRIKQQLSEQRSDEAVMHSHHVHLQDKALFWLPRLCA